MKRQFDTNVFGLVDLTNRVVPEMIERGRGDIVNIASTSGLKGHPGGTAYSASKWALRGISQCWQAELRPHGVRVVSILPSEVQTGLGGQDRPRQPEQALRRGHRPGDLEQPRRRSTGPVARARGVCHQPLERGLSRLRRRPAADRTTLSGLTLRRRGVKVGRNPDR